MPPLLIIIFSLSGFFFGAELAAFFAIDTITLFYAIKLGTIFIVVELLFTLIYKTLPDGKMALKTA